MNADNVGVDRSSGIMRGTKDLQSFTTSRKAGVTLRAGVFILCVFASACGLPRDADGTLDRVQNGTMRVGVITGAQAGIEESALVRELAHDLSASVEWIPGTESDLLKKLHDRDIDMVIGGLTDDSPWASKVAFSKPFGEDTLRHVLALPPGENGWLVRVEWFLAQRRSR